MLFMSIQTQTAYPNAQQVMNRARAFVNDAFRGGAGRILTDQAPFTTEYLNAALEELQDKISTNGVITLIQDNIILSPITPVTGSNPAQKLFIGYNGFFNGTNMVSLPRLPSNLITIDKVWERQTGSGLPFKEMTQPMEGLPSILQGPWLNVWEYRQDAIYLTGSTIAEDLRVRGQIRFVPVSAEDNDDFANVEINILASVNALATLVAYNYARARGAAAAQQMQADAEKMMRYIVRRYTRRAQGVYYNRRGYGESGDRRGVNLPY